MPETTPHQSARAVLLATIVFSGSSLLAAPPKAIRVEPLGIAPGATSELVIHGINLTKPTDLLSTLRVTNPQTSIQLQHQVESETAPLESKLAAGKQPAGAIVIEAEDYSRGKYRRSGIFILNGNFTPNYAEYDIEVARAGAYQLELKYAAGDSRPVKLYLNGRLLTEEAAAGVTGGFGDGDAKWMVEGVVALKEGKNILRLERPGGTPHFDMVGLVPTNQPASQFSAAKPSDRVAPLRASIDESCPVGIYGLRVATAEGITKPLLFMVDDLPTLNSLRDNHTIDSAQPIELPTAIDGVTESGNADYFQFSGIAGEWVSVEAVATRLGTKLDPVIRVLNQAGGELAFIDDSPALAGDCRLRLRLPGTGTFFVAIEDSSMGGSSAHAYRLRIGDFPLRHQTDFTRVAKSELQQFRHSDDEPFTSAAIGGGFSGRFDDGHPIQRFRFAAKKGDRLVLVDRSREFGAAAMLGLAIRDEAGKLVGENQRAGTSGGSLTATISNDGTYDAEISELTRRSGPDYVYYAELRRSIPDFELTLDIESVILPQDGYAIVKVTANRKGYNGPIKLSAHSPDGELTVSNEVILEKKKDTRLKVYIPKEMQTGQALPLRILGTTAPQNDDTKQPPVQRTASTLAVLRKNLPQTPHPPFELQTELAAVVGPAIPDFFALSLDGGAVLFPRYVGEVYFTVRVKDRTDGFKSEVALRVEGLPAGFSAGGGERAVSRSDNNEYRFQLRGPAEMDLGTSEIRIIGEASFKGQTKGVTLAKLPLRTIEPLIITATAKGNARPGTKLTVNVSARRFVPRAGGDMTAITLKLADGPAGFTLAEDGVIPAAKKETQLELQVAATVQPGKYNLMVEATNEVAGHKFSVQSSPFQIIVAN
ncbi:MAG: hypothetical protein ACI92S_000846 [Planctomycetaceae bacterium]|jgi:hypothetical protein